MLFADDQRVELAAGRVERIHRGVDAERCDVAREHDGRVKVREGRGGAKDRSSRRAGTYTAWMDVIVTRLGPR